MGRRTLTEARISTAERKAGGPDQDTRGEEEEAAATGGQDTEEVEGAEGTGDLMSGSVGKALEDAETTGTEEAAPAGLAVEVTPTTTVARRRVSMAPRRWVEAGTLEAMGGRLEEVFRPEEEVTMVIGTGSRCTTGRLRLVESAPPPCRGWTWRRFPPASVRGRMAQEPATREITSRSDPTEVARRGRMAVMARLVEVGGAVGAPEEAPGEEARRPEEHRGGAGAGSLRERRRTKVP